MPGSIAHGRSLAIIGALYRPGRNFTTTNELGVGRVQVTRWRERYCRLRPAGIERDLPRGPPPSKVDVTRLVRLTTQSKPDAATHRNMHTMTAELGVSTASVSRHWRADGLKPHLVGRFKVSRVPKFVEKLEDIASLHVSPSRLGRDGAVLRRTRKTKCRRWIACSPGRR